MNVLKEQLEANAKLALNWFTENQMKANPSIFQTIISNTVVTKQFVNWIYQTIQ